jgi:hypothetical protein
LLALAGQLVLYAHTPLPAALATPASHAKTFFDGKTFEQWRKHEDHAQAVQMAIIERLNQIIRTRSL